MWPPMMLILDIEASEMGCCSRDKKIVEIVEIFSHLCFELDYNQTLATQQLLFA